jgi:hypothetical protein
MPFDPSHAWKTILDTANKINLLGSLSKKEIQRIKDAANVLTTRQTTERRKRYKLFLHSILRDAGPGAVLLCAVALGQVRITDLKDSERVDFCNQIKPEAIDPNINALAIQYSIPRSVNGMIFAICRIVLLTVNRCAILITDSGWCPSFSYQPAAESTINHLHLG